MDSETKKYSTAWLYGGLAVGAVCGALIYHFFKTDPCLGCCPDDPKPGPVAMSAFFDRTGIETITEAADAWGGRFYIAKGGDGSLSVLAGAIKEDGSHIADASGTLQFMLFKAIDDTRADVTYLTEDRAEAAVKDAATATKPAWSIDVSVAVLRGFFGVGSANAIGFLERSTTDENWSFDLAPVKLSGGSAYLEGTPLNILAGAYPCPMHCPRDPAMYLHTR